MADTIPVLWSDDIKVDVVTPLAILRSQVGPLRRITNGILDAEISTVTGDSKDVRHLFDLVAPVLNHYRHRILTVTHHRDLAYPVTVEAECFQPKDPSEGALAVAANLSRTLSQFKPRDWRPVASTEQEFIDLVRKTLRSNEVRSIIQSLIARSNDLRAGRDQKTQDEADESRG